MNVLSFWAHVGILVFNCIYLEVNNIFDKEGKIIMKTVYKLRCYDNICKSLFFWGGGGISFSRKCFNNVLTMFNNVLTMF